MSEFFERTIQLHDIGRGQRWALQQDKKISDMLFDALIEYVRLNLFGHGERHYQRALSVLIWLSNESRFANHPGQEYVSNLNSEVQILHQLHIDCVYYFCLLNVGLFYFNLGCSIDKNASKSIRKCTSHVGKSI